MSLNLCRCGELTVVYWLTLCSASAKYQAQTSNVWRGQTDVENIPYWKTSMSQVERPSQLLCQLAYMPLLQS